VRDATLVSWNVAGRLRLQSEQAERVIALSPDIVCLQEIIASAVQPWTDQLAAAGMREVRVAELAQAGRGAGRPLA
jgi:exonuclease III